MRAPQDMPAPRRRSPLAGRGRIALMVIVALAVVLIISLRGIASFYTEYLWFDSVDQTGVWRGVLGTKLMLAVLFGAAFFVALWASLFIADRFAPTFRQFGPDDELLERYHDLAHRYRFWIRSAVSLVFAVVIGSSASSQWNEWLLFRNGGSFGATDPQFGRDIGFYVFKLPFLTFVGSWAFTALLVVLIITGLQHYLNGGIRVQAAGPRLTNAVKAHLSVLLGLAALVQALRYWLHQFSLTTSTRGTVDGATYTDVHAQLPAIRLLILISIAALVLFLVNIFLRGWVLPTMAVALWLFVAVVAGALVPTVVQTFRVQPSESSKEAAYIRRNIEATREAMNLHVETRPFAGEADLTNQDLLANAETLTNARLWDPADQILGANFQQLQALRDYYEIQDVDTDRYVIDGQVTQVMVAARELNTNKVPQKSWEATHLAYTHGYGVVLAPANKQLADGRPEFLIQNVPVETSSDFTVDEPGLYFGDALSGYVVVNTQRQEIDYHYQGEDGEPKYRDYEGADGVGIGSLLNRAAFALRFGDINLLVSGNIGGSSKVLFHRSVQDRVSAIAPFLSFDADPYPVILDGRVQWVVDAYTTTDRYPYAQRAITDGNERQSGLRGRFNYVRNSVKATVDAYDGTVTLYVIDEEDPIIAAYRKAFPDLFSAEGPSADLQAHFRYPEDLFRVQTNMWGRYHIGDPDGFYNSSGAWLVARDPSTQAIRAGQTTAGGGTGTGVTTTTDPNAAPVGPSGRVDPYYLLMALPGEPEQSFVLYRPFVPGAGDGERQQLTSFMVAHSDPDRYGKLVSYVVGDGIQPDGPALVANTMLAEPSVSALQVELGVAGGGSDLLFGNLITIPIEQSLLYVRPVYVQASRGDNKLPLLRKVVVEFNKQVAVANTLADALRNLAQFRDLPALPGEGGIVVDGDLSPGPDPGTGSRPTPGTDATIGSLLTEAADLFAQADAALASSDLAGYADKVAQARAKVTEAQALLSASTGAAPADAEGSGDGGSSDAGSGDGGSGDGSGAGVTTTTTVAG